MYKTIFTHILLPSYPQAVHTSCRGGVKCIHPELAFRVFRYASELHFLAYIHFMTNYLFSVNTA